MKKRRTIGPPYTGPRQIAVPIVGGKGSVEISLVAEKGMADMVALDYNLIALHGGVLLDLKEAGKIHRAMGQLLGRAKKR